jgi:hypothetical protein
VAARLGLWLEKSLEGSAAKLLSKDEARRIALNIAKLPELLRKKKAPTQTTGPIGYQQKTTLKSILFRL